MTDQPIDSAPKSVRADLSDGRAAPTGNGAIPFAPNVFSAELKEIAHRRELLKLPRFMEKSDPAMKKWPTVRFGLFGLALSGGGIRSATFNLGLLQALAEGDVLKWVDYLSTVSGGGYIGSCLTVLMKNPTATPERANCPFLPAEGKAPPAVKKLQKSVVYLAQDFVGKVEIFTSLMYGILFNLITLVPLLLMLSVAASIPCAFLFPSDPQGARGSMHWFPVPQHSLAAPLPNYFLFAPFVALFALPMVVILRNKPSTFEQHKRFSEHLAHAFIWSVLLAVLLLQPSIFYWLGRQNRLHGYLWTCGAVMLIPTTGLLLGAALRRRWKSGVTLVANSIRLAFIASVYLIFTNTCNWLLFSSAPMSLPGWLVPEELTIDRTWQIVKFSTAWFFGAALILIYWGRNVNASSMHRFYHARLRAAYLFFLNPDVQIASVRETRLSEMNSNGNGPFQILNSTLNLHGSRNPELRRQKSDAFIFSKLFTGSNRTGYCSTQKLEAADKDLELGTAMAISGAAVSANMGTVTVGPLISLMAMLNLRLAYWLPNPGRVESGVHKVSLPGAHYFLREMFGRVNENADYVHLSDGGHHENLGALELLRRRCALIVVGDSEADPDHKFGGLTRLCELAKHEGIANINVETKAVSLDGGKCLDHCVITHFQYYKRPDLPLDEEEEGILVYVKSSLTCDEDLPIKSYQESNPAFPHEPTSQQFYSDRQFECYRQLGLHIGRHVLKKTKNDWRLGILCDRNRENENILAQKLCRVEDELKKLDGLRPFDVDTAYWAFDYARSGRILDFFRNWIVRIDNAGDLERKHQAKVLQIIAVEFLGPLDRQLVLDQLVKTYGEFN